MLVLTRKHDEQIVIGENGNEIVITVLKIQGSEKVSIGIEAHPSTPIFRRELLTRGMGNTLAGSAFRSDSSVVSIRFGVYFTNTVQFSWRMPQNPSLTLL